MGEAEEVTSMGAKLHSSYYFRESIISAGTQIFHHGSFNNFTYLDDMKQSANDPSMWEYNYRIVGTSDCEFRWQFVRDEEMTQLIYPATSASTKSDFVETTEGVVVLGADDA